MTDDIFENPYFNDDAKMPEPQNEDNVQPIEEPVETPESELPSYSCEWYGDSTAQSLPLEAPPYTPNNTEPVKIAIFYYPYRWHNF